MRYYDLQLIQASSGNVIRHWTSHPQGIQAAPDRGALQVEFDLLVYQFAPAAATGGDYGNSSIKVYGLPLADVAQSENWSGPTSTAAPYTIKLSGGMGKGLPLAMPSQAGLLLQGDVWRAVGNWVGTEMLVEFLITPLSYTGSTSPASQNLPGTTTVNLSFNWPKGTPMAAAINSTLSAAFPGTPINIQINPGLVLGRDQPGIYTTMGAFADFLNILSKSILGPNNPQYLGVRIAPKNGTIAVYDGSSTDTSSASTAGTTPPTVKTIGIAFTDLVGQPTWIANGVVQVTLIMRGDISVGDTVTLPQSIATVGAGAISSPPSQLASIARFSSQFQGNWTVLQVRHVGNYKSPNGMAWVTVIQATSQLGPLVPQNTPTPTPAGDETFSDITITPSG